MVAIVVIAVSDVAAATLAKKTRQLTSLNRPSSNMVPVEWIALKACLQLRPRAKRPSRNVQTPTSQPNNEDHHDHLALVAMRQPTRTAPSATQETSAHLNDPVVASLLVPQAKKWPPILRKNLLAAK